MILNSMNELIKMKYILILYANLKQFNKQNKIVNKIDDQGSHQFTEKKMIFSYRKRFLNHQYKKCQLLAVITCPLEMKLVTCYRYLSTLGICILLPSAIRTLTIETTVWDIAQISYLKSERLWLTDKEDGELI